MSSPGIPTRTSLGAGSWPGKSIVFAITKQHAARLCKHLNDLHPEHKGNYAQVITSDVSDASEIIVNLNAKLTRKLLCPLACWTRALIVRKFCTL